MTQCPFCKVAITEDLIRFGGNCPACLIEIPGEEAPTDPGEEAIAREVVVAQALQQQGRRKTWIAALAAAIVCAVGGWWLSSGEEPVTVLEFDEVDFVPAGMDQHVDLEVPVTEEAPVEEVVASAPVPRPTPAPVQQPVAAAPAPVAATTPGVSNLNPLDAFNVQSVGPQDSNLQGIVLSEPADIRAMVQRVMTSGQRQVDHCYTTSLNNVPDLSGVWKVSFTITTSGAVSSVSVQGQGASNTSLEECIERRILAWKFQAIASAQPVTRSYRFNPSGF